MGRCSAGGSRIHPWRVLLQSLPLYISKTAVSNWQMEAENLRCPDPSSQQTHTEKTNKFCAMPTSLSIFILEKAVQRLHSSADVFIQNGVDHIHFNTHIRQEIHYISSTSPLLFPSLADNSFLKIIMLVSRDIYTGSEMNKHPHPCSGGKLTNQSTI